MSEPNKPSIKHGKLSLIGGSSLVGIIALLTFLFNLSTKALDDAKELGSISTKIEMCESERGKLQNQVSFLTESLDRKRAALISLRSQLRDQEAELARREEQLNSSQDEVNRLQQMLSDSRRLNKSINPCTKIQNRIYEIERKLQNHSLTGPKPDERAELVHQFKQYQESLRHCVSSLHKAQSF